MSEISLVARHPSPVRYVPAKGRVVRRAFEAIDTPVSLRRAGEGSFEPLPRTADASSVFWRKDLHVHEDALWRRLRQWEGEADRPLRAWEFAAFLSGERERGPRLPWTFQAEVAGTPILARLRHAVTPEKDALDHGGPVPPSRERWDDPERARRALRAFLETDVRVEGDADSGTVWVRATPMAEPCSQIDRGAVRYGLAPAPRLVLRSGGDVPVRPDRPGDYLDGVRPERRLPPPGADAVPPSAYLRDDDIVQLANQGPGFVEGIGRGLVSFRRSPQVRGDVPAEVAAAIEEMADLARWGAIGAIAGDEVEAALVAVARAAQTVEEIQGRYGLEGEGPTISLPGLLPLSHHIRRTVLPRLDAADPAAEAGLALLAP